MTRLLTFAAFLAVVFGGGTAIGILNIPGDWYAGLNKPWFNPPNWIFGPVWSVLYVLIAWAGWRTWERARNGRAMKLWFLQLVLNFFWSPVFFGWQKPGLALIVILALLAVITMFIRRTRWTDPAASAVFVPYALWVAFASLLNASIFFLN